MSIIKGQVSLRRLCKSEISNIHFLAFKDCLMKGSHKLHQVFYQNVSINGTERERFLGFRNLTTDMNMNETMKYSITAQDLKYDYTKSMHSVLC